MLRASPRPGLAEAEAAADVAAVAACRDGDPLGLEHLYQRHGSSCLGLARRLLRDRQYAEDAVQEAFLDLWRTAGRFDASRASARSWLLLLTHRRAVDRVRTEQRQSSTSVASLPDRPCDRQDTEMHVERALAGQALRRALRDLPGVQQEALVLAYWGGYSQSEVARLTRAPLGTVKDRTRRAMLRLALTLKDEQGLHDGGSMLATAAGFKPTPTTARPDRFGQDAAVA